MVDIGAFILLDLLVGAVLLATLGSLVAKCRAAGDEWRPRSLRDVERDADVEDPWRDR
ncbi:hypothetical protein [Halomicrococcus gelatinilyticus]|uniref:hypothetical protein n=1 Tax=Halomicrococcus gelatinilyticus TaxID=1702103 RepID=UPI002E137021